MKLAMKANQRARQWLCYWIALPFLRFALQILSVRLGILPFRFNVEILCIVWLRVAGCRGSRSLCSRLLYFQRYAPAILSAMLLRVLGPGSSYPGGPSSTTRETQSNPEESSFERCDSATPSVSPDAKHMFKTKEVNIPDRVSFKAREKMGNKDD